MTVKSQSQAFKVEYSAFRALCESIDSPRSLTCWLLATYGEWGQYLALSVDPLLYEDADRFADDYLVTSILQKSPRLPIEIDRRAVAEGKFRAAETVCKETNSRLDSFAEGRDFPDPDVTMLIAHAIGHVHRILGPLRRADLDYVEESCRFGPGATTSLSGVVTQGAKYKRRALDVTPRLLPFRTFCFPDLWRQNACDIRVTDCSKVSFVPKNSKTDRTICIEPDLNIFVQLGIGALLRKKLEDFGLDLSDQSVNQNLAREGSITDTLCTMDLSAASDSISRSLVWLMLPYSWADLLHFARVDKTRLGTEVIPLEKWSSMGNGYTFELETLIFYSLLLGACEIFGYGWDKVSAYGDDLIFPSEFEDLIRRALNYLGFSVNPEKTFGKGHFRESCGADWFKGVNVRPIFFRSENHDFPSLCYSNGNAIRRYASKRRGDSCDSRFLPAWIRLFTAVPEADRHRIPEGFGDVGFISNWDEASPWTSLSKDRTGYGGYFFRYRSVRPLELVISSDGAYLAFLNGKFSEFRQGREALRGRFRQPTRQTGYSLEWPNLGSWC